MEIPPGVVTSSVAIQARAFPTRSASLDRGGADALEVSPCGLDSMMSQGSIAWAVQPYLVNAAYCMGCPTLNLFAQLHCHRHHCRFYSPAIQDRLVLFHDPLEKQMHDISGLSNPAWHQVPEGCPTPDSCQASFMPVLVRLGALGVLVDKAQVGACRLLSPFQDVGLALHMVLSYMTRFNSSGLSNPYYIYMRPKFAEAIHPDHPGGPFVVVLGPEQTSVFSPFVLASFRAFQPTGHPHVQKYRFQSESPLPPESLPWRPAAFPPPGTW